MPTKHKPAAATKQREALALRWGRVLEALDCAKERLKFVERNWDLLGDDERRTLLKALSMVVGLEQRLWKERA